MLRSDMVEWVDEPFEVGMDDVEPGMIVRYEYGDFGNFVNTGVLWIEDEGGDYGWHIHGERVSDTDWSDMDDSFGSRHGGVLVVGYFDLDDYYSANPDVERG